MMELSLLLEQLVILPPLISMASKYWIKLYHEILDDPKMARLSDGSFRRAIELFLLAGDHAREGLLPAFADIAWRLRVEEASLLKNLQELQSLGIVTESSSGKWSVTHFKERQNADSGMKRMRRLRDSRQMQEYYGDEPCDDPVTKRNADIDIDKEVEGEREEESDPEERSANDNLNNLSRIFVTQTWIPEYTGGIEKWQQALEQLNESGVEGRDMVTAIEECAQKNLTITCLSSIVNPAIIARSKRLAAGCRPQEDHRRYAGGKFGEFVKR
jgi:hypothetical protein